MQVVTVQDLTRLGEICSSICYYLTAHLASLGSGQPSNLPPEVAQIYHLALRLPKLNSDSWSELATERPAAENGAAQAHMGEAGSTHAAASGAARAAGSARPAGTRLKWTPELEKELVKLVQDESYRSERLGKEGTRGGAVNWAAVSRYFGLSTAEVVKRKYADVSGEAVPGKKAGGGVGQADADTDVAAEVAAKKRKTNGSTTPAPAAAAAGAPAKKKKAGAAAAPHTAAAPAAPATAAAPTPAGTAATPGDSSEEQWTKHQDQELVALVEQEAQRKEVLGKKKLRWKRISEHLGKKVKACRRHYAQLTGKAVPEDEE